MTDGTGTAAETGTNMPLALDTDMQRRFDALTELVEPYMPDLLYQGYAVRKFPKRQDSAWVLQFRQYGALGYRARRRRRSSQEGLAPVPSASPWWLEED